MDLAFASLICPPTGQRAFLETKILVSTSIVARKPSTQKTFTCLARVATPTRTSELDLENRKHQLLSAIQDTQRGLVTSADQRSSIEEALSYAADMRICTQNGTNSFTWDVWDPHTPRERACAFFCTNVSVESCDAGAPIDLEKLDGTWRLQYTSASDVLILLDSSARLPFFQVGQIFQKFECRNHSDGGIVRNVVRWSIPNLLEEQEGATLLVSAKFSIVSLRNIYLQFEEIAVQNINISDELQALIAPAILPRSFLSLQILQFIRSFKVQVPVSNPSSQRAVGGLYYLSYLDANMLLGRAGGGGVFVFTKAQPLV